MPVPQYYKLHIPMLKFLGDGQPHNVKEVRKAMKEYFHLTDEEASQVLPSKRQTVLANRVGWASTYLKRQGCWISRHGARLLSLKRGKRCSGTRLR